jgi:hypothetical protein
MSDRLQPAFFGGLLIGVLSALPFVNSCCCLWIIGGGVLTTYLLQERLTVPVSAGNAAVTGLLAGVFGAVISSVLSPLISLVRGVSATDAINDLMSRPDLPPEFSSALERVRDLPGFVFVLASLLLALVLMPPLTMLGSLLGVAIFRKTPPPPPPGTVEILPPEPPHP